MEIITHYLRLPSICLICQMTFKRKAPICYLCEEKISYLTNACWSCASPCNNQFCIDCQTKGSALHRIYVGYPYQEPLKSLVIDFKFKEGLDLTTYLAEKIIAILPPSAYETQCLVPIPMHRKKLIARGFNQSLLLTKKLSQLTHIPYQARLCEKIYPTSAQSKLARSQRHLNLLDSFSFRTSDYRHITLIDDVCTTGTTLKTLAQGFSAQGVSKVDAWVICKA